MCGIAGIINFDTTNPVTASQLQAMADSLEHRGPDELSFYLADDNSWGLAHSRLAIIDIAGGSQPMVSDDGRYYISYNGECYNFRQLRDELQQEGFSFKTDCDTEVVLAAYIAWGPDCVQRFNGMFAIAIWDSIERRLFIARDRLGQKPLYYANHDGQFIFASECKAILTLPDFPRRLDKSALGQYLLLQYTDGDSTGFADIKQLPPAHCAFITESAIKIKKYWQIPQQPTFQGTIEEAAKLLREKLEQAVRLRMISDVPLGAFLSGGLDSTIIVGLMSQLSDGPVKTCSIGFEDELYNELPFARRVADKFKCDHQEYIVKPDCANVIGKLAHHYDSPFADCSALPTYHLSLMARQRVTVALTGDAGDECFGGYDRYKAMAMSQKIYKNVILRKLAGMKIWQKLPSGEHRSRAKKLKRFLAGAAMPADYRYLNWLSVFNPQFLEFFLTFPADISGWSKAVRRPFQQTNSPVSAAMLSDINCYLPGDLNVKTDRASMAHSLELRSPFQDHQVAEFAFSLPPNYRNDGKNNKKILRLACFDLIPRDIASRAKAGFGVPVGKWFRSELRDIFVDTCLSKRAISRGLFHEKALEDLLKANDKGTDDHGHKLWSLLMLELWQRSWLDK
ncbi:MAG: asparagine synthase (glutamine-hydrolyzing) [Phycisphaerae bacterium]|nr:asparagine synthase (glutamine-hydrolyzing) [Phycisphaerae bacterium]